MSLGRKQQRGGGSTACSARGRALGTQPLALPGTGPKRKLLLRSHGTAPVSIAVPQAALTVTDPVWHSPADPNGKHQEVFTPQANSQPYSGGFHTFAVDWTADTITSEHAAMSHAGHRRSARESLLLRAGRAWGAGT